MLRWVLVASVGLVGCSASGAEGVARDDQVVAGAVEGREIKCWGLMRRGGQLSHTYRVGADGVRDGIVRWAGVLPDGRLEAWRQARLDVRVERAGERWKIRSTDEANGFQQVVSVSASGFAGDQSASLDGRLEETSDEATREAPQFMCKLGIADFHFVGDEAAKFANAPNTSGDVNVGASCMSGSCYLSMPAFVDRVEGGVVRYAYDLERGWSEAFARAFPDGLTAKNPNDGKSMTLSCPNERCRIEISAPDRFLTGSTEP